MVDFYINGCSGTLLTSVGASATNSDFTYINSGGTTTYRLFTDKGRYFNKVLNSLGYTLPQGVSYDSQDAWLSGEGQEILSAYPLLAFFKAYNDYMSQSQRFNISALSAFLRYVKQGKSATGYNPSTGQIDYQGLTVLFDNLFLCYDNDYFTSAWRYPASALGVGADPGITASGVPAIPFEQVNHQNTGTWYSTNNTDGTYVTFSQRALDWLQSFDA